MRAQFRRVKPFGEITIGRRCSAAPILGQSGSSAPPCWTLDVLNSVLGSATIPVAVGNVPLRTASASSVRRDADRRARDARAPHFTRELEELHPDMVQIGLEQEETEEAENSFLFSRRSLLTLFAPVETPCFVIAHRARCLAFAVKRIGENR